MCNDEVKYDESVSYASWRSVGEKFTTILSSAHKRKAAGGRFVTLLHTHQFVYSRKYENTHNTNMYLTSFTTSEKVALGNFLLWYIEVASKESN